MRNEEHFTRIAVQEIARDEPETKKTDWWRMIWIALAIIFFFPFIPGRRRSRDDYPTNGSEYLQQLIFPLIVTALFGLYFLWQLVIKPSINKRRGYVLRGKFEVISKSNAFGRARLKLQPGINHSIQVDKQIYKFINVGDNVLVEKSALGEVIKVKKI